MYVFDLEVHDNRCNKSRHANGNNLGEENMSLRQLHIMRQLVIVREVKSVHRSDHAKTFEEVHGQGIARLPSTSDELGEDTRDEKSTNDVMEKTAAYLYWISNPVVA